MLRKSKWLGVLASIYLIFHRDRPRPDIPHFTTLFFIMASVNLTLSEVLRQASCIMASTNEGVYEFPQVTTTTDAVAAVADILKVGPTSPLVFTKPKTKQHVAAMRKLAHETFEKHTGPMIYRAPPGHAPPAAPAPEKTREAIRRMALLDIGSYQPYALSLNPHIAEGFRPALVGCAFTITGLEGYEFSHKSRCQITPANVSLTPVPT